MPWMPHFASPVFSLELYRTSLVESSLQTSHAPALQTLIYCQLPIRLALSAVLATLALHKTTPGGCCSFANPMPPVILGQRFESLQAFKTALRSWAIDDSFNPSILDSDSRRVRAGCRYITCLQCLHTPINSHQDQARIALLGFAATSMTNRV